LNPELNRLLKGVSRSFYLTLRVLPRSIRPQIGLAYLLARTGDTMADTELLSAEARLAALESLRARILGQSTAPLSFGEIARHQGTLPERSLLDKGEHVLGLLKVLAAPDLQRVRQVLEIIIGGQELDLRRFADASLERISALRTDEELNDYTYRVAGCVGEFWTKMCRAHLFPRAQLDEALLIANGVRFGKGLQLTNILRDLPVDLRQGRCYLPSQALLACGLQPQDLLRPENEARLRPLYDAWLDRAAAHLRAGAAYTNALPRSCVRVRLACAWPILLGFETLKLLRAAKVLEAQNRIKASRSRVRTLMVRSIVLYPWSGAWARMVESPHP